MLTRSDPFREFDRLTSTLFDQARTPRSMPLDAYRQGEHLMVRLDLPGVDLIVSERPQGAFSGQRAIEAESSAAAETAA